MGGIVCGGGDEMVEGGVGVWGANVYGVEYSYVSYACLFACRQESRSRHGLDMRAPRDHEGERDGKDPVGWRIGGVN
jgi:hypothetical protein